MLRQTALKIDERADFLAIVSLVNNTLTTQMELEPIDGVKGRWSLFAGSHRIQGDNYPIQVLYLHTDFASSDVPDIQRRVRLSHTKIVCPPSAVERRYLSPLKESARGFYTPKDYIASFIADQLSAYRARLRELAPPFYSEPRIASPPAAGDDEVNPLRHLLTRSRGELAILLADPGQGKTYFSDHLVSTMSRRADLLPILVNSQQWSTMSPDDLSSVWKAIVHSFRYFKAPIGWLEGCELDFLRTTLKADLFRLVFDGFDEYSLRNRHALNPLDLLRALVDLVGETNASVLLTSRTSFWTTNLSSPEATTFLEEQGVLIYQLLPFDHRRAKVYFEARLPKAVHVRRALQIFGALSASNENLAGRGFVLPLAADLAEGDEPLDAMKGAQGLRSLISALCQREIVRHELPYSPDEQLSILRFVAAEMAAGETANASLLHLAMEYTRPDFSYAERTRHLDKFEVHPLLSSTDASHVWSFTEEQVKMLLLAQHVCELRTEQVTHFVERLRLTTSACQDLTAMLVDLLSEGPVIAARDRIADLLAAMRQVPSQLDRRKAELTMGRYLAGLLALISVNRFLPIGSERSARAEALAALVGSQNSVEGLNFAETIGSFDFSGFKFHACVFDRVHWDNCIFDQASSFEECHFLGSPSASVDGLASAQFLRCVFDEEAAAWIRNLQLQSGLKRYSLDDLQRDMRSVVAKFSGRGGLILRSLEEPNLHRGSISSSRYKNEILDVLTSAVLDFHVIPGVSERGVHVRKQAEESVRYFVTNNIFIGPLREAYDKLRLRLKLDG
jgi:hypothetical protein